MALDRVSLRLEAMALKEGVTHEYTDWQVSTNRFFTDTVFESLNDSEHKMLKTFYGELEEVPHYSRARVMLSTGYTKWTDLKTFTPTHIDGEAIGLTIPIEVGVPKVTTTCDYNNHCLNDFTIKVTRPPIMGNTVEYVSTTYIITDIYDNTVFISKDNVDNQDELTISSITLKPNSIYRLHAYRKTSSDNVSGVGTCTIKTTEEVSNE